MCQQCKSDDSPHSSFFSLRLPSNNFGTCGVGGPGLQMPDDAIKELDDIAG